MVCAIVDISIVGGGSTSDCHVVGDCVDAVVGFIISKTMSVSVNSAIIITIIAVTIDGDIIIVFALDDGAVEVVVVAWRWIFVLRSHYRRQRSISHDSISLSCDHCAYYRRQSRMDIGYCAKV
jgi:hypothetical protein